MGMVHEIKVQKSAREFVIRNKYTGELTDVRIDDDKFDLFSNTETGRILPEACPFFRLDPKSQAGLCTVHLTWPDICRDFGCWKFLIKTPGGKIIGRIFSPRMLISEDPGLNSFWESHISLIRDDNDQAWEHEMVAELASRGYEVFR